MVLGLLAFVAYDMRDAALAYLGINPSKPEVEFEIRLPKAAASAVADTQIELHTDRNQTLAQIERELAPGDDGRSVLRGSVPLDFRTTDRVVILNLPGQPQSPVQTAAGGKPQPLRSVRPVAPGRSRRLAGCATSRRQPSRMTPLRSAIACSEHADKCVVVVPRESGVSSTLQPLDSIIHALEYWITRFRGSTIGRGRRWFPQFHHSDFRPNV